MKTLSWFDNIPVIGNLPPEQAIIKLREVGEYEAAERLEMAEKRPVRGSEQGKKRWPFQDKLWQHTSHTFGYIPSRSGSHDPQPIRHIEAIDPDLSLRDACIKITLNRLRVASYPGGGMHRILLHVCAQNQIQGLTEPVHFNTTYRVQEGGSAGIQGYPLFVGLNVGHEGVTLKCRTINIHNDQDEALLSFMESDTFKAGLRIISTAQPVIAPFSEMALGLAKALATRNRNHAVQDFSLGLDFNTLPLSGCLAEGAYLAVQVPEKLHVAWDWEEWVYMPTKGRVVKRNDHQQLIPYNYLVFGISRYEKA